MASESVESVVLEAWREVLARPDAGLDDDFEASGGTSLLKILIVSRVQERAGVEISSDAMSRLLFTARTARSVASLIETELAAR